MKKMKFVVKILGIALVAYSFLALLMPYSSKLKNRSIEHQINFLLEDQEKNALELQNMFPEGYIFYKALLALSIIEYSKVNLERTTTWVHPLDTMILDLVSIQGSKYFPKNQDLEHGAFYNGWVNFTLKEYLNSDLIHSSIHKEEFRQLYDSISNEIIHIQQEEIQIVESYPGSYWPADNMICAISLPDNIKSLQDRWIQKLKANSLSSMINHDDTDLSKVRGSSQSLMCYLLSQHDSLIAREEYQKFSDAFIKKNFGMYLVKEDRQHASFSDIDSGPVLYGFGSVATIVHVKAASRITKRPKWTEGILNLMGLPINCFGKKYYLFQQQKMFDIFMLWIQL